MPIPQPKKDEEENDFIKRCMSDAKMIIEYPDRDQRLAVCSTQWDDKNKE